MTDLLLANRWAKQFLPRPQAPLRLFCFPYAGAGASALRRWMSLFPADIEVRPIEYPGRWTRQDEPFCHTIADLAAGAAQALAPLLDRPYAVLGYSLGALVAFEWLRLVEQAGLRRGAHFFACAQLAPQAQLRDRVLHTLPDSELLPGMEAVYGRMPGPALDPELMALVLPTLRADLQARESYCYRAGPPLSVPLQAWGGAADRSVQAADLDQWRQQTTAAFAATTFPGGHFFIATAGEALRDAIMAQLSA